MEHKIIQISNGIRFVYYQAGANVSHCGMMIGAGSRNDNVDGVAHFVEHMFFKGTENFSALELLNKIELYGGEINAYTSKEETCYYVSIQNDYVSNAFSVLSEMLSHSIFKEKELKKERQVILDELESYNDSPAELIFDDFEKNVFEGYSIGKNVLGTKKSLKNICRDDLIQFVSDNYTTDNIVLSYVGALPFEYISECISSHFSPILKTQKINSIIKDTKICATKFKKQVSKKTNQYHCVIGIQTYDMYSDNRLAQLLLSNIIGGPSFNSLLNLELRENKGISYVVESQYTPFSDTGLFTIYFGTDEKKSKLCIDIIKNIFDSLSKEVLSNSKFEEYKKQLVGQLALSVDNLQNVMINQAKSVLLFNKVKTFNEVVEDINSISIDTFNLVIKEKLIFENYSFLIFK